MKTRRMLGKSFAHRGSKCKDKTTTSQLLLRKLSSESTLVDTETDGVS